MHFSEKAKDPDPTLPEASLLMCCTYLWMEEHQKAQKIISRLLAFAPNSADALAFYGYVLLFSGRAEEAVSPIIRAQRLDPGRNVRFSMYLAFVYNLLERHEEAIAELERYLVEHPSFLPLQRTLAYAYCQADDMKKAEQTATYVIKSDPGFNDMFARKLPFNDPTVRNQFIDTLRRTGFS